MNDETGHRAPGGEAEGLTVRSGPSSAPERHAPPLGQGEARREPSGPQQGTPAAAPSAPGRAPTAGPGPGQPASPSRPWTVDGRPAAAQNWANPLGTPGGPATPQAPYRPAGPAGPTGGLPVGGAFPGGASPGAPQPRGGRGLPLWAVLLLVMVVAMASAGVGGVLGASLGGGEQDPEVESAGALDNEVPSDVPSRAPDTIAGVAQRVNPSVVSIRSASPRVSGNGSGFVIEDGYVVTNNHVVEAVERAGVVVVVYSDGHTSEAEVVGTAPSSDLAVLLPVDPLDVEPLEFGDSDQVTVGDTVIAIGAPLGLEGTVTSGIVSALNRPVTVGEEGRQAYISAIQTDAAINPGNSGGPLVNEQGMVIGVNSAIATMGSTGGAQSGSIGLGFAIPSNQVARVAEQLIESGEAPHAIIGAVLDLQYQEQGALIMEEDGSVVPGGPADQAGLRPGDVIVEFDGTAVRDANQLVSLIHTKAPGDRVEVRYVRGEEEHTAVMVLGSSDN